MVKKILWEELRRTEFEQAVKADAVVIIPVASTEQHGDHLPVNTDSNQCFTIATRAAQAIDEFPVLVLPVVWTGYSPMFMSYPGTITLKFHTLVGLLTDIAISVHAHGFRKILLLNGHGGNRFIIAATAMKLAFEEHIQSVIGYTQGTPPYPVGKPDHAGEEETSMQLYLQPELVDTSAAVWAPGVLGDPSSGTRDKGEHVIEATVDSIVKLLRDYHSGKLDERLLLNGTPSNFMGGWRQKEEKMT